MRNGAKLAHLAGGADLGLVFHGTEVRGTLSDRVQLLAVELLQVDLLQRLGPD